MKVVIIFKIMKLANSLIEKVVLIFKIVKVSNKHEVSFRVNLILDIKLRYMVEVSNIFWNERRLIKWRSKPNKKVAIF